MLLYLDLLSTFCFACSGALFALKINVNIIGAAVAALLSSTGGGTIRELLLSSDSLFWLENLSYLFVIGVAITIALFLNRLPPFSPSLCRFIDAFGTVVFIKVGVLAAVEVGCNLPGSVLTGVLTGIGGGLLREAVFGYRLVQLRDYKRTLTATLVSVLCLLFVVLESGLFASLLTMSLLYFAIGEYRQISGQNLRRSETSGTNRKTTKPVFSVNRRSHSVMSRSS